MNESRDWLGAMSFLARHARQFASERNLRRGMIAVALAGLALGVVAQLLSQLPLARLIWTAATLPVIAGLAISIVARPGRRPVRRRCHRAAVDDGGACARPAAGRRRRRGDVFRRQRARGYRGRPRRARPALAGRSRAADRASAVRRPHRGRAVDAVAIGDRLLVRGGEVVPVDGVVFAARATIDESALTGEPIPVDRGTRRGGPERLAQCRRDLRDCRRRRSAGESTYAGIVRLVTAAQTAQGAVRAAGRPLCADACCR